MLSQMRLLPESFTAIRTRIRTRFDVNAPMLQQRTLLFKLFLTDRTAHVQGHSSRAAMLNDIRKDALIHDRIPTILVEVLQLGEIRPEDRVIYTFGIFEVSGVLQRPCGIACG